MGRGSGLLILGKRQLHMAMKTMSHRWKIVQQVAGEAFPKSTEGGEERQYWSGLTLKSRRLRINISKCL